jgi:hypothetical protein
MKPAQAESNIGLDRLATWNEIRTAISFSFPSDGEIAGGNEDFLGMESDFGARECQPQEDHLWLAIANKILDSPSN